MLESQYIAHFTKEFTVENIFQEKVLRPVNISQVYSDFNNFHLHFLQNGNRLTVQERGYLDVRIISPKHYQHSHIAINQTYREFYATIDMVAVKISRMSFSDFLKELDVILWLRRTLRISQKMEREEIAYKFLKLLKPIRENLYQMGYNWNDLCR